MRYEAPRRQRIKRYGMGVRVKGYWWLEDSCRWVPDHEAHGNGNSFSYAPCRTIRAFRRMLREHPHIRGRAFWANRYVGHSAEA